MCNSTLIRRLLSLLLLLMFPLLSAATAAELAEDGSAYPEPDPADLALMETKIGASLVSRLNSPDLVPVVISLKNQPMYAVSQQVQARYWAELRANEQEIRTINRKYSSDTRPENAEEAALMAREQAESVSAADRQRIRQINERSKNLKDRMRKEIMTFSGEAVAAEHIAISDLVRSLNGSVLYTFQIMNSVAARVPGTAVEEIANHPLVAYVTEDDIDHAHLNVSVPTTLAGTFWAADETGGVWWNATCDTGVDTAHPALLGKTWWQGVFHAAGSTEPTYNDNSTSTDDLQGHGTHVAGIANSTDATNRGVSYGSTRSTNLKAGWRNTGGSGSMSRTDAMAAVHWGFSNATMDAINLSFGSYIADDDHEYVRFWDAVVDAQNTIATISAGNDGPGDKTLSRPGIFYNGLCVAWVEDQGTTNRNDDLIANDSSRGPTWNDRKKPDIAAPGGWINAPAHNWESTNPDFVNKSGTSMAAPHVSGGTILLHDVGIHEPRTIKAILINTADFIQGSTGWNKDYGWGYMNLDTAYLRRTNYFLHSVTPQGTPGWYKLYKVPNPQVGDKTTMVWNRHVVYNNANYPTTWYSLNDLNLRYYRESTDGFVALSGSGIDNVEQVVSTTTDPLVIRAYAWASSFSVGSTETFALAVPPGTVAATGPVLSANAASSAYTPPVNSKFLVSVRVNNTSGDLAAHNCVLTVSLPSGVSLISGSLVNSVGTINAGSSSSYIELWLKATTSGTKTVSLAVTSNSYGIDEWTGSGSFTVTPGVEDTVAPYTIMPIGGPTYQTGGTDKIANGGFESDLAGWATSGAAVIETGSAHGGTKNLKLGPGTATAYQTVSISGTASRATLTFWYKVSATLAGAGCQIRSSGGDTLAVPYSTILGTVSSWTKRTVDVTRFAGQTVQVYFYSSSGPYGNSTLWVDDVSLKENENVWVVGTSALSLLARDDNSGVDYSQYTVSGSGWNTYSSAFTLSGQSGGYNSISYRSVDNGNNVEPTNWTALYLDDDAPKSVLRIAPPTVMLGGTEKVTNGGFEAGMNTWTVTGSAVAVNFPIHSGSWAAKIGHIGSGSIYQDVPISASATRAFASVWFRYAAGTGVSYPVIYVRDPATGLYCWGLAWAGTNNNWNQLVWDVSGFKGSSVRLEFVVNVPAGDTPATLYVDDVCLSESASAYVKTSSLSIHSAERVGVDKYEYDIDSAGYVEGSSFVLTGSGAHTILYRALDRLGHQETGVQTQLNVDDAGPTGSISINGGAAYTASQNVTLTLSATDPVGVAEMRIQSDSGAWGGWQMYETSLNYTLATSGSGTKTIGVQFRDTLGNSGSTFTDTIEYRAPVSTDIPGAKMVADYNGVSLSGKVVTGIFPTLGYFYISEPDRNAGIRVRSSSLPASIDRTVSVVGITRTVYAEREIVADDVVVGGLATTIPPVGMNNVSLGGSAFHYQPAVPTGASGLNNVGLLVTAWGRVTYVPGSNYYIDDGSNVSDSAPTVGVLVRGGDVGLTPPAEGQYLDVTGISSASTLSGNPIRVLRPRNAGDIRVRQFTAAFVFDSQQSEAQDFKNLLDSRGAQTTLVPYSKIEGADWTKYHTVLIGSDTGNWTDPAKVSAILAAGTPIVAIGSGGAKFLDAVTSPDLFIGWGQSALVTMASGQVFGGDIYTYPHNMGVSPGDLLIILTSSSSNVLLHDPNGVSNRMIVYPAYPSYFAVASEFDRFYQWGYILSPQYMTDTGKNLFTNLVFRTVSP